MSDSPPNRATSPALVGPVAELPALFAADRAEHGAVPPLGKPEYSALRARDRERRTRALPTLHNLRAADAVVLEAPPRGMAAEPQRRPEKARLAHDLCALDNRARVRTRTLAGRSVLRLLVHVRGATAEV
jgi:hypothetical protein